MRKKQNNVCHLYVCKKMREKKKRNFSNVRDAANSIKTNYAHQMVIFMQFSRDVIRKSIKIGKMFGKWKMHRHSFRDF